MSYIDDNLYPDEEILAAPRIHWAIFLLSSILLIMGAVLFDKGRFIQTYEWLEQYSLEEIFQNIIVIAQEIPILLGSLFLILVGGATFLRALYRYHSVRMWVTTNRVIKKVGLLSNDTREMSIGSINGVDNRQSALGSIMGYGHVIFHDIAHDVVIFPMVKCPKKTRTAALEAVQRLVDANINRSM